MGLLEDQPASAGFSFSSHRHPSYLSPRCRRCVYRFSDCQLRCPLTAATCGIDQPIANLGAVKYNHRMTKISLPTDFLRERFSYCPATGVIVGLGSGRQVGRISTNGYLVVAVKSNGKTLSLLGHRLAWQLFYGTEPASNIDHRNRDKLDNRIDNLRLCNQTENQGNYAMRSNNSSGYRGVYWSKHHNKWVAQLRLNGKTKRIGGYSTPEEASAAYMAAASKAFGEFTPPIGT